MTAEALEAVMAEHIGAVASHYRGRVLSWDVVNEPIVDVHLGHPRWRGCSSWRCAIKGQAHGAHWRTDGAKHAVDWSIIGPDYVEKALRYARAADPHAKLFLNEYGIHGDTAKTNYTLSLLAHLRAVGAPLDGIGVQLHVDNRVPSYKGYDAAQFGAVLARYAALGLEVHITEMDVRPTDPMYAGLSLGAKLQTQGALYASALAVCRAQPRCTSFQTWGFTDRHCSFCGVDGAEPPGSFYFDRDYLPKPALAAVTAALVAARTGGASVVEEGVTLVNRTGARRSRSSEVAFASFE